MSRQTSEQIIRAIESWLNSDDDVRFADGERDRAIQRLAYERRREEDWATLELEARNFASRYGAAAMLRCVSEVLKD